MKLTIIFKQKSDHARSVTEFIEMFGRKYPGKTIEQLDIETREGAEQARLYGITTYPGFIVKDNSGVMVSMWQGEKLPLIDEVAGYLLA
jgi:hypothetical protein